eukprot:2462639-Prymnesium_polylepis.1
MTCHGNLRRGTSGFLRPGLPVTPLVTQHTMLTGAREPIEDDLSRGGRGSPSGVGRQASISHDLGARGSAQQQRSVPDEPTSPRRGCSRHKLRHSMHAMGDEERKK